MRFWPWENRVPSIVKSHWCGASYSLRRWMMLPLLWGSIDAGGNHAQFRKCRCGAAIGLRFAGDDYTKPLEGEPSC